MKWYWWLAVAIIVLGTLNSIASGNSPLYAIGACAFLLAIIFKLGGK